MIIRCVWEHNGEDSLLYAADVVGAYARGASRAQAMEKMESEVRRYFAWSGEECPAQLDVQIAQEEATAVAVCDADSEVLFDAETGALTGEEYARLKALALKSAADFERLYAAVPDPDATCLPERRTFYGARPRTAREMYTHTKNVNAYYFGEIGVDADNDGTMPEARARGFALLEAQAGYLDNAVFVSGSPFSGEGERWTLRKLLRRFIWHDRIHAKAMYRMAVKTFGAGSLPDVFGFEQAMDETDLHAADGDAFGSPKSCE